VTVKKYTVDYVLGDDGWWTASVREVRGAHTQGRSIAQARRRVREALGLFVEDAAGAELVDHIRIDADTRSVIRKAAEARRGLERQQKNVSQLSRTAVKKLTARMSVRDASEILGVSPQRVQQLASS
jgi:predicted RNase H-like HicB family nuclease